MLESSLLIVRDLVSEVSQGWPASLGLGWLVVEWKFDGERKWVRWLMKWWVVFGQVLGDRNGEEWQRWDRMVTQNFCLICFGLFILYSYFHVEILIFGHLQSLASYYAIKPNFEQRFLKFHLWLLTYDCQCNFHIFAKRLKK